MSSRLLEMVGPVLEWAQEPFPVPVRTLDAMHLASIHLRERQRDIRLATYDPRLVKAGKLGISLYRL